MREWLDGHPAASQGQPIAKRLKQGQVTWQECRDTVQACRNGVRKSKTHRELRSVRDQKDNKQGFNRCISGKRKTGENVGLLLNVAGNLKAKAMEKAEERFLQFGLW